jgi:hypothetical protein
MSWRVAATPETVQQIVTTLLPDGSPDIQTVAAIVRAHVVPGAASELTGEPLGDRTMRRIRKLMRPAALALVALGLLLARDGRATESPSPSQAPKPKGRPACDLPRHVAGGCRDGMALPGG